MIKHNYKILYAEDDDTTRENYKVVLEHYFKNVYTAKDGEEAYKKYIELSPDILLLDINMPKVSGLEVARKIKKLNKNIQIIMLTAYSEKDNLLDAIDIQVNKYLIKPVKIHEFEKAIELIIDNLSSVNNMLEFENNIYWDLNNSILYKDDKKIKLSKKEEELFKLLTANSQQTLSSYDIINHLWPDNINKEYDTKPLRSLIFRIKSKLGTKIIESIYDMGYVLKLKD